MTHEMVEAVAAVDRVFPGSKAVSCRDLRPLRKQ